MEHSEEHLREILTENDDLKLKLKGYVLTTGALIGL